MKEIGKTYPNTELYIRIVISVILLFIPFFGWFYIFILWRDYTYFYHQLNALSYDENKLYVLKGSFQKIVSIREIKNMHVKVIKRPKGRGMTREVSYLFIYKTNGDHAVVIYEFLNKEDLERMCIEIQKKNPYCSIDLNRYDYDSSMNQNRLNTEEKKEYYHHILGRAKDNCN